MMDAYLARIDELRVLHPDWWHGRLLYIALRDTHPDLADQVHGTPLDPFHTYGPNETTDKFWIFIDQHLTGGTAA